MAATDELTPDRASGYKRADAAQIAHRIGEIETRYRELLGVLQWSERADDGDDVWGAALEQTEWLATEYEKLSGRPVTETARWTIPIVSIPGVSSREAAEEIVEAGEAEREHISPQLMARLGRLAPDQLIVGHHIADRGSLRKLTPVCYRGRNLAAPLPKSGVPVSRRARCSCGIRRRPRGRRMVSRSAGGGSSGDSDKDGPGEPAPAGPSRRIRKSCGLSGGISVRALNCVSCREPASM